MLVLLFSRLISSFMTNAFIFCVNFIVQDNLFLFSGLILLFRTNGFIIFSISEFRIIFYLNGLFCKSGLILLFCLLTCRLCRASWCRLSMVCGRTASTRRSACNSCGVGVCGSCWGCCPRVGHIWMTSYQSRTLSRQLTTYTGSFTTGHCTF